MSYKFKNFLDKTKKIRRNLLATFIVAAVCVSSVAVTASISYKVNVVVDGEENIVTTLRSTVEDVLEQAGVEVDDNDTVDASGYVAWQDSKIVVTKNSDITITDDDNEPVKMIATGTVADAFKKAGISIHDGDEMNCELTDELTEGMEIEISRAFTVTVVVGEKVNAIKIIGGTVADALEKAGIEIESDQKLSHKISEELKPYMIIEVIDVDSVQRVETEKIPYKTIKKNSDKLLKGKTKVEQKGVEGEKKCRYLDTYEGKELVSSELIVERVIKEPVDEIILVGTKQPETTTKKKQPSVNKIDFTPAPVTGDVKYAKDVKAASELTVPSDLKLTGKNIPTEYKYKITGTATAYSAEVGPVTSTGRKVKPGYVAVDPREIPYGTEMWIVGPNGYVYGYAIAADTGGFIYTSDILMDLFYWTESECNQWGVRGITVYVL